MVSNSWSVSLDKINSQAPGANPGALPIASCLNCLSSMQLGTDVKSRTATAVDFVAVKASRFNSFQQPRKKFANSVSGVFTPVLPSTPKASTWLIHSPWAWTGFNRASSRYSAKSNTAAATDHRRARQADPPCLIHRRRADAPRSLLPEVHRLTSSRNTPSSRPVPCGTCRTPLLAHSRNSIRCRSSRPRPAGRISQPVACVTPSIPFRVVTPRAGSTVLRCRRI
jgi:hypothetical protein